MKIPRLMRIFKLVKLVRVLKASSVFQRWQIYTSIGYSDLLNIVMLDTCMPISLQHISMEYLREAKYHTSMSLFRDLAQSFSPQLRGTMMMSMAKNLIHKVPYIWRASASCASPSS